MTDFLASLIGFIFSFGSEAPSDVERIREMDIQRDLMSDIPAMRPSNPTEMNINIQEPLEISKP